MKFFVNDVVRLHDDVIRANDGSFVGLAVEF